LAQFEVGGNVGLQLLRCLLAERVGLVAEGVGESLGRCLGAMEWVQLWYLGAGEWVQMVGHFAVLWAKVYIFFQLFGF